MAAEKKEPVSKRAYKNSPRLERKEDGKLGVSKKAKESEKEQAGTSGMEEHESHALEMGHKHEAEHLALNQKHEKERHELRAKQMKAHVKDGDEEKPKAETGNEGEKGNEKNEEGEKAEKVVKK
jgi:hypothetical protein